MRVVDNQISAKRAEFSTIPEVLTATFTIDILERTQRREVMVALGRHDQVIAIHLRT
jgi:hypothetical protein